LTEFPGGIAFYIGFPEVVRESCSPEAFGINFFMQRTKIGQGDFFLQIHRVSKVGNIGDNGGKHFFNLGGFALFDFVPFG